MSMVNFVGQQQPLQSAFQSLAPRLKKRPILFLGLGGIGSGAVAALKTLYEETFRPHMREGQDTPIPPYVRFLCFDSDRHSRPANLRPKEEWHQMVARRLDFGDLRKDRFYERWIPSVSTHDYTDGAAGQRALGRVLFVRNINNFADEVSRQLEAATTTRRLDVGEPLVWIFAGLAGGTGSGALLDACFYLRRNHPRADIYGTLAVVGGVTGLDARQQETATVGTFSSLKEIDAFMAQTRLSGPFEDGTDFTYPGAQKIRGRYARPFNHCFLVGPSTNGGVSNLVSRDSLCSYMGRHAFMFTAYTTAASGRDRSFESDMCDKVAALPSTVHGAVARYSVPALSQLHVPQEAAANFLCCKLGEKVASELAGGHPCPDEVAAHFASTHKLTPSQLVQELGRRRDGQQLVPRQWSKDVEEALDNKRYRYSPSGKKVILSWGEHLASGGRAREYAAEIWGEMQNGRSGSDVQAASVPGQLLPAGRQLLASVEDTLRIQVGRLLMEPARRLNGAIDFLSDFEQELEKGLRALPDASGDTPSSVRDGWRDAQPLVVDICTKGGFDWLKLDTVKKTYSSYLDNADAEVLEFSKRAAARELLLKVKEAASELRRELVAFGSTLGRARELIDDRVRQYASELSRDAAARGVGPENICSFGLLDIDWCERYLHNATRDGFDAVIDAMAKIGWHPLRLMEVGGAADVAQSICETIEEIETRRVRNISLPAVLSAKSGEGSSDPIDEFRAIIEAHTSPQMRIQMMADRLDASPTTEIWMGGVTDEVAELLRASGILERAARSVTWESDKVIYVENHFPVALAGCDDLVDRFSAVYDDWSRGVAGMRDRKQQEVEVRKFHCFPGSDAWQSVTHISREGEEHAEIAAQAFGISAILDPTHLGEEFSDYAVLENALANLHAVSKSPKEKRLALFFIGSQHAWLTPFFDIESPRDVRAPIKLDSTLSKVLKKLKDEPETLAEVRKWVTWFDESWTTFFSAKELAQSIDRSLDQAKAILRKQTAGSEDHEAWTELIRSLEAWRMRVRG